MLATGFRAPVSAQFTFVEDTIPGMHHINATVHYHSGAFVDFDNDGDLDLVLNGLASYDGPYDDYRFYMLENIGTPTSPSYTELVELELPRSIIMAYDFLFYDLDGDGDLDLFLGPEYYENIGGAGDFVFAEPVLSPYSDHSLYESYERLVDLNGDGKLDVATIMGTSPTLENMFIQWHENTGTSTAPVFADALELPMAPFYTPYEYPSMYLVQFADLDGDGDLDMLLYFYFFYSAHAYALENIGSPSAPNFNSAYQLLYQASYYGGLHNFRVAGLNRAGYSDLLFYVTGYPSSGKHVFLKNTTPLPVSTSAAEYPARLPAVLSPNPASEIAWLEVELPAEPVELSVRLLDLRGKLIWQRENHSSSGSLRLPIPLDGLPAGLYAVQVIGGSQTQTLMLAVTGQR